MSLLLVVLLAPAADTTPSAYLRPDLLMEAAELKRPEVARKYVILDARGKGAYKAGHAPGALWLDAITWERAFKDGQDEQAWSERIGGLGLHAETRVVVYDDNLSKDAARMWWILRYWGLRDVRLLNGGWRAWKAAGGEVETRENTPRGIVRARLTPVRSRLAAKEQVKKWVEGKTEQILDARSTGEFCGETETAKRNGAIPGAKHLEWSDTLDRKTGRFKSAAELAKLFKGAGIDPARPTTTYCQSGGRAAVLAFVVELMGGKEVRNYYRSWSEWGNAEDTPIERPRKK
jgi:thiosulfate/3-mercaptopyruvate sulfurtransferase